MIFFKRTRIKLRLLIILLVHLLTCTAAFSQQNATFSRKVIIFNNNWKFKLGDYSAASQTQFNDAGWESVGLPHSFSTPYFMSPDFYVGYGWYRKEFKWEDSWKDKYIAIEFEAAFQDAEIFVNGKLAGTHKGGYTGFSIDITHFLARGKNLVAVRLNNLWNPGLAPRAGEHVFSGGIYRDVQLAVTAPVHVDWCGTFITTPKVSKEMAAITVHIDIKNHLSTKKAVRVETEIFGPDGLLALRRSQNEKINAAGITEIVQNMPVMGMPKLWHPDHPYLYHAVTRIYDGSALLDNYDTTFGIRTIAWSPDKGFLLNGERLYLRGANVHQDHAGWGDAVTNAGFYRDVKMMKDAGFNFIRGSHYPHDPSFVAACDSLGMIFWSENAFWGIGGSDLTPEGYWNASAYPTQQKDRTPFEESLKQQLAEMIRIHRNHPSVVVWSMSNEPFFTAKETIDPMRNCLKELVALSHNLDPTRAAAIGGGQRPIDSERIDILGDVAGYNGDGGSLAVFQNPGIPNIVSEYGSTTSDRPGGYEPGYGDIQADEGKDVHPWRSGQAIWCGFDHGSIAGARLGKMGIVDYFRIPKRAWYYYRDQYMGITAPKWPVAGKATALKLEADRILCRADGSEDIQLLVTVLNEKGEPVDNNPDVILSIISGPGEFPTGNSIHFEKSSDIRILDGKAAIEVRSFYSGATTIRATAPGLEPSELKLEFIDGSPYDPLSHQQTRLRPYSPFINTLKKVSIQQFGRNNPTFASSSKAGNNSSLAADGKKETFWQPEPSDKNPSWILDTEKKLSLNEIAIYFPDATTQQYLVEISQDNRNWRTVLDQMQNTTPETKRIIPINGETGGMIRIQFKNSKARLSEVEVRGTVID